MATSITGPQALKTARQNRTNRRFPGADDPRHRAGLLFPAVTPSFQIGPGDRVFTIGSCFARNVESKLDGFDLPTRRIKLPAEDVNGRGNSILNEFTPACIAQRIGWALDGLRTDTLDSGFGRKGDLYCDMLLRKLKPRPMPRLVEIRTMVDDVYRDLPGADALIVTLGMAEGWFDNQTGLWLNRMPEPPALKDAPERFQLRVSGVDECTAALEQAFGRLIAAGLGKIILTVSPVPLESTFTTGDCITANTHSKAVMRLTAENLCQRFPGQVDYFPAFEIAQSGGLSAFREDLIHPCDEVVAAITQHMVAHYVRA